MVPGARKSPTQQLRKALERLFPGTRNELRRYAVEGLVSKFDGFEQQIRYKPVASSDPKIDGLLD